MEELSLERPLPHSRDSERIVLGAILLDNSLIEQVKVCLQPDDFYAYGHDVIFRSMLRLTERGSEIDPFLIAEELRRDRVLEQFGGTAFISDLTYGVPHFSSLTNHIALIRRNSSFRRLIKISYKVVSDALEEEEEPSVIAERALKMISEVGDPLHKQFCVTSLPELSPLALQGLAGDFVRRLEPHTESDPAALLIQFLVFFGSCVGPNPHFNVEGDQHHCNLFTTIVGVTGNGRKGTSAGRVRHIFRSIDEAWERNCISRGLSSGEGLIWSVRDPVESRRPLKEKGRTTGQVETVIADHGVTDKRLLVLESEFASVLRAQGREGNTLSAVIRQAWDDGNLRSLTKNSPARASGAYISIIGHITNDELQRCLGNVERFNGYANRFIWALSRRSKYLPDGGALCEEDIAEITHRLKEAVRFARRVSSISRDEEAQALWWDVYPSLSSRSGGLFGSITARAAPQVLRLAMIYALLDTAGYIRRTHLEAALAVWRYSEDSVRYIFGEQTGDQLSDELLKALRKVAGVGLTRTEINGYLYGHYKSKDIHRALSILAESGLAVRIEEKTSGRSIERWFAISSFTAEKAEKEEKDLTATVAGSPSSAYSAFSATSGEN
ncbi:MAG: DUF3987 domain-containing protein [Acidobacteriota bacterium]|nr:DUF3987 domain-containing protein [Acidobacteriota bacterium]